jgi:hypothetical protein
MLISDDNARWQLLRSSQKVAFILSALQRPALPIRIYEGSNDSVIL